MSSITESMEWKDLLNHFENSQHRNIMELFKNDVNRFENFSLQFNNILVDYSKNLISEETIGLLIKLAEKAELSAWIDKMFSGEHINNTEDRAVLHVTLRNDNDNEFIIDGQNISQDVKKVKAKMKDFVNKVHNNIWLGYSGKKITDIVNIGIGGSDLGPAMVSHALSNYAVEGINIHYVSNVDGTDIQQTLKKLNPQTVLFIIASKTFTTQETMTNAHTARNWFLSYDNIFESDINKHFIALSTNTKACNDFGIPEENMFEFWNWVGGRYSLWSAIGLSIALYIGYDNFEKLLHGANQMDNHFKNTPFDKNLPVLLALITLWYSNFYQFSSQAIIPYDEYLKKFPDFLQQLDMESNGKYITKQSTKVDYKTGPIIWGTIGTNSQHSFFQLIHQGTQVIPVDFLVGINNHNEINNHQNILFANCIAQSEALMKGKNESEVISELEKQGLNKSEIDKLKNHKVFLGNRPSNVIIYNQLTPEVLGSLIALYEHKVFVLGVIWDINSFDQWGVELGKQLCKTVLEELETKKIKNHDQSTTGLINFYLKNKFDAI